MSMNSKVNKNFQTAIVDFIAGRGNENTSNYDIYFGMFSFTYPGNNFGGTLPSLRAIQEATQKLTKAGVLASPQRGVYRLATEGVTITPTATAATV
jgi:hypothetical protein